MRHVSAAVVLAFGLTFTLRAQQHRSREEKAAVLGAHLASEARSRITPLRIAGLDEYLAGLGQQLAAKIPNGPKHWEFAVSKQPGDWAHEPLGLPGGYVFVPAALIASAEDEAELAGMLAHAMVHAALPLPTWNGGTIPLVVTGRDLSLNGGSTLVPMSLRAAQREREIQADLLSVQILSGAGFDPDALLTYLRRAQPRPDLRSQGEIRAMAARLERLRETLSGVTAPGERRLSSSSFALVQDRVREEERSRAKVPSLLSPSN